MLYKSKNPHGGDIYEGNVRLDFSANTNPAGTPKGVIEAAAKSLESVDCYPDPYARELKAALSEYHEVPEEYILLGAGAAELIYSYAQAGQFKKAMLIVPTFSEYELGLRAAGDTEVIYEYAKEETDFQYSHETIFEMMDRKPDVVFICNPNNPTGRLADPDFIKDLVSSARELGIKVFLDECFIELAEGESMIGYLGENPNLTVLRAFTKNYAMEGLRLGYVLSSDEDILSGMAKKVQPWNISIPAQAGGLQALKEKDFLKDSVRLIKEEREYLAYGLKELGLRVIGSDVNFLLFKGPEDLTERMKEQGILIRDCSNYEGLNKGWFRIAVKLHDENVELLRTMREVLGKE